MDEILLPNSSVFMNFMQQTLWLQALKYIQSSSKLLKWFEFLLALNFNDKCNELRYDMNTVMA